MSALVSLCTGKLQHKYGDMSALEIAKASGADAVDFNLIENSSAKSDNIYARSDEEIVAYYERVRQKAESLGLIIGQTHGRIKGFRNIAAEDEQLVKDARIDCLATATLKAPVCVMHSATSIFFGPDVDPQFMRDLNFDMFTRILPFARQYNVKVATETFGDATGRNCLDFFGDIREFLMSYHRVCAVEDFKKYFTICVDTGHSNKATRYGQPSAGDVLRMCGGDVTVLHLNDNDTLTDQHKPPLSGSLDWKDIMKALKEIGYKGTYNMEVNLAFFGEALCEDTAAFSVKIMKSLLAQQ